MKKNFLSHNSGKMYILAIALSVITLSIIFSGLNLTGNVTKTIDDTYYWDGIKGIGIHDLHYQDISGIKGLEVTMIRNDINWESVEVSKGVYNFDYYDNKTDQLLFQDIASLYIIDYSNCLYNSMPKNQGYDCYLYVPRNSTQFESFKTAYGNYVYQVVSHYKGKVNYFELWNEPNEFWQPLIGDELQVNQYIELMKEGYNRAKEANPDAIILSAGIGTWDVNLIDQYIKNYYAKGAKDYFHIRSIHPYCYFDQTYPLVEQGKTCEPIENIADIKQIMDYYNDSDKKIWITEYGYPTDGCSTWDDYCEPTLSEDNQNTRMINLFSTLNQNYSYVTGFFWYDYMDDCETGNPLDIECRFGLVRSDLSKKPAYYTYQNLSSSPLVNNSSNSTSNQTATNVSPNKTSQSNNVSVSSASSVNSGSSSSGGGGSGSAAITNPSEPILSNNYNVSETEITEVPASLGVSGSGEKVSPSRDMPSSKSKRDKEVLTMTSAESNKCCISNSCYSSGKIVENKYCDESSKEFLPQKEIGTGCSNSFECISNNCAMNKCSSESFISKAIKTIRSIFKG
jgi:hypothetical protein